MMKKKFDQHQYYYQNDHLTHHYGYLLSSLLDEIFKISDREKVKKNQKIRILDLGCGNGSFTNLIAQQGYEIVGIEESEQGIEIARRSFPTCNFIQSSIYSLPYDVLENSFDVVLAVEVIEHLFYPRELLRAARRCVKPDGYLIITTPYHGYLKNLALAMTGKMDQHFTSLWDGGHIKFFSVPTMRTLLTAENFADIKFTFSGRLPYLWKSMVCLCSPAQS